MTGFTYSALQAATTRPEPFSVWTDEHISAQMLRSHLDPDADGASRAHPAIKSSLDWIVKRFDLGPGKRVIDFGCGPGLYTTGLAECGVAVTDIDFSRRSLEHARGAASRAGLEIDYIEMDYRSYRAAGVADLVTLIYCDLCPLAPADRHALLCTFRDLISGGGHLLLDVVSRAAFAKKQATTLFAEQLMDGF